VDGRLLDASFAGREFDESFLKALPAEIDPCGERGEFHTFVFDGPEFATPVRHTRGGIVPAPPFWYCPLELEGRGLRVERQSTGDSHSPSDPQLSTFNSQPGDPLNV
jgi:diphthamide synthase (EF-2-diphthine--ammonia ligase)